MQRGETESVRNSHNNEQTTAPAIAILSPSNVASDTVIQGHTDPQSISAPEDTIAPLPSYEEYAFYLHPNDTQGHVSREPSAPPATVTKGKTEDPPPYSTKKPL